VQVRVQVEAQTARNFGLEGSQGHRRRGGSIPPAWMRPASPAAIPSSSFR